MSRRAREKTDDRGRQQRRRKTSASASASSSSSSSSSGSAAAESPVDLSEDEGGLFVQMYRFPGCSSYASRPIFTTIAPRRRAVFVFAVPARGVRARP